MNIAMHIIETLALAAVGWGLWMAWPPLCPIGVGGFVLCLSVYARTRGSK